MHTHYLGRGKTAHEKEKWTYHPLSPFLDLHNNDIAMKGSISVVHAENENIQLLVAIRVVHVRFFIIALVHAQITLREARL